MNNEINFDDLESDLGTVLAEGNPKNVERFPCVHCGGSGKWRAGGMSTFVGKCHACKGIGSFKTNPHARAKAKAQRANRKVKQQADNLEALRQDHPAVIGWLEQASGNFATSLLEQAQRWGNLSEKQVAAVEKIIAKDAERRKPSAQVDLSAVFEKFATAIEAGIKSPKLRLNGFSFSLAKSGANRGHLYVKDGPAWEDAYLGKVSPDGEFFKARDCSDEQLEALLELSADVLAAAKAYGRKTGSCSCCGRELTNAESIAMGIGPICASNWGL